MFLRCSVWRDQAEHVAESLSKGDQVIVQGKLEMREYEAQDGSNRQSYEITAYQVGASLQFRTIKHGQAVRSQAASSDDPWGTPPPAEDSEPPF